MLVHSYVTYISPPRKRHIRSGLAAKLGHRLSSYVPSKLPIGARRTGIRTAVATVHPELHVAGEQTVWRPYEG
jgi:hypothetical protein